MERSTRLAVLYFHDKCMRAHAQGIICARPRLVLTGRPVPVLILGTRPLSISSQQRYSDRIV